MNTKKPNSLSMLKARKKKKEKFACLTTYDATMARVISAQGVECLLVGDSLAMVIQGNSSTLFATLDDMVYHTENVRRGNQGALLMVDVPVGCAYNVQVATDSALRLMRAGAEIVKLEADAAMLSAMKSLSRQGIPLCAHFGLRPQQVAKMGGYKVQGRDIEQGKEILRLAREAEQAGVDMLLLECVVVEVAKEVTQAVSIPTIGIGSGKDMDAQVLVTQDMLGLSANYPGFVKDFMAESAASSIAAAISLYHKQVLDGSFPTAEYSYQRQS